METSKIKIDFGYTDEFGQESRLIKTFDECVLEDMSSFELLVEEFKLFVRAAGFTNAEKISITEDEE